MVLLWNQFSLLIPRLQADGRLLHLYMKQGPPNAVAAPAPIHAIPTEPRATRPVVARAEPSYDSQREQMDRNRRRAEPELQDGSYGFEAKEDKMDVQMDDRHEIRREERIDAGRGRNSGRGRDDRGLYSDDLYPRRRGRGFR